MTLMSPELVALTLIPSICTSVWDIIGNKVRERIGYKGNKFYDVRRLNVSNTAWLTNWGPVLRRMHQTFQPLRVLWQAG